MSARTLTFDDHELANNWAGDQDEKGTPSEIFALRRAAAFQAWYEHMPVRRASFPGRDGVRTYRGTGWGNLVSASFLDTRQYRSDQACGDGDRLLCSAGKVAPFASGQKAPQGTFCNGSSAAKVAPFASGQKAPQATFCKRTSAARAPERTMLGMEQERWLLERLTRSTARWNVIAQQVLMMDLDLSRAAEASKRLTSMDSWGGYPAARERLLCLLQERKITNTVVLSGDAHQHFAGDVLRTPDGAAIAAEFLVSSATSGGDGLGSLPGNEEIIRRNPSLRMLQDRRGYGICSVTHDRWTTELISLSHVTSAQAPSNSVARFVVEPARPGIAHQE